MSIRTTSVTGREWQIRAWSSLKDGGHSEESLAPKWTCFDTLSAFTEDSLFRLNLTLDHLKLCFEISTNMSVQGSSPTWELGIVDHDG